MSVARNDPATIHLGGEFTQDGSLAVSEAVTPGHLVERFNAGGVIRWRKCTTVAVDVGVPPAVALNQSMLNKGVDDVYAAGDLAQVGIGHKGSTWWMFIASGQDIAAGASLESAGDGTLRAFTQGVVLFTALENKPTVTVQTRLRVEVV